MDELEAIEEVERRHKACEQTTREQLELMAKLVGEALEVQKKAKDVKPLKDVATKLKKMKVVKKIREATVEYHSSIKKAEKVLDQKYTLDVNEAARHERLDPVLLKKVILNHLYREGLFDVAEVLAEEAGLPADAAQEAKEMFTEMHRHLELICKGELTEPLAWAVKHRTALRKDGAPSQLEFKLQRLIFLQTMETHGTSLVTQGVTEALQYAQKHLQQFQGEFMPQIKQLMGRLLYSHRALCETPYGHLDQQALLEEVATDFTKATCRILGQASTTELLTVAAAGSLALPQLCKLAKVTKAGLQGTDFRALGGNEQMPIEIELSLEFYFHSIFACPVSKEQCLKDNPPKMLPCGHVLGSNTIDNLAGLRASAFKCPYCPEETSKEMCRTLTFPDVER